MSSYLDKSIKISSRLPDEVKEAMHNLDAAIEANDIVGEARWMDEVDVELRRCCREGRINEDVLDDMFRRYGWYR